MIVTFWEYDLAMNDLFIIGSSYLIPNNKEWSSNLEPYKLRFAEYGDWNALLNQGSASQDRLLIYFLDDLLPDKSYSPEILEEILRPLIMLLEKSLQTNRTPIIACISEGQNFDVIRYSKGGHYLQKAFRWLLDEFETLAGIYEHFYILDLKHAFGEIGFSRAFDNRNWCFAHCRLSTLGIRVIAKNTRKILERHYSAAAKVLVLDCDNTIGATEEAFDYVSADCDDPLLFASTVYFSYTVPDNISSFTLFYTNDSANGIMNAVGINILVYDDSIHRYYRYI